MNLRPTTVRRLAIILGGVLLLVGIGAGLYYRNEHRKAAKLASARAAGMAAYKAGDYRGALDNLKTYTWKVKADTEALHAFAVSRTRIEVPNGSHITEGIALFTTLLQAEPGNLDAKHRLLDLYTQAYYNNEANELASRLLADRPDDQKALLAKCTALERMHKYPEALAASEKLNELAPQDLEQQLATYRLMRALKRPDEQLIGRARYQQQRHPDDPRFHLLLAWVYGTSGDMREGMQWLKTATTRPAPDATYVQYMVRVLDQLKLYRESQGLLDRAVKQSDDPKVMRVLVQRLWQNAKNAEVIERLKGLDAADPKADTGLLAYRALALFETGRRDEAKQVIDLLGQRAGDNEAVGWATALKARFNNVEPKAAIEEYQASLVRSPDNAVVRYLVGEAYARMGETELALAAWKRAAEQSPSWATPRLNMARALAAANRTKDAVEQAYAAYRAAPDHSATITALAAIRYKNLEEGNADSNEERSLLALVEKVQQEVPGEAETLPVYVNLLARTGKKGAAAAAVRAAIEKGRKYDQTTIVRLLAASRAHQLGLEEEIHAAGGAGPDDSPRVAFSRATDLAAAGKPQDGLALLETRAKGATTQPVQWQLALAQYREIIRDADAAKDWVRLGDAHPNELTVQNTILKMATSARADRDFIARTIDRVRALTGPEGQTWKLERARWLIGSDSPKDAAEAVNTLGEIVRTSPTLIDARVLLARAYETVGNLGAAGKELQAAVEQDPTRENVIIELARVLQAQDKFPEAKAQLERAAGDGDLSPEARRQIAALLGVQGELARAAAVMESPQANDVQSRLLLAELYRRQGRGPDAERVYAKLLENKPVDLETIRAASDFYAQQQKLDAAQKVLDRLPEAKARPGVGELALATFNERWGSADAARRQYAAATAAAPKEPGVWYSLVTFHLRGGRYEQARQAADEGMAALPDHAGLKRLRAQSAALAQLGAANASLAPVLAVLGSSPDDRGVTEFLVPLAGAGDAAAAAGPASRPGSDDVLARLRSVSGKYPKSLPVQRALVQWYVSTRQFDAAGDVAARMVQAFPGDPEAARAATAIFRANNDWTRATVAARQWRDRSGENPRPALIALAEIELARGDAPAALQALDPYLRKVTADPQSEPAIAAALVRAYATGGREADARKFLLPLLPKDRSWRLLALRVAGMDLKDPNAAAAWIKTVEPMAADNVERQAVGEAWYRVASRSNVEGAMESAAKALDPIAARPDAPADVLLLRGAIADREGDLAAAEQLYRRGLKLAPDRPEALNNLAYLLTRTGKADEAVTLARQAVQMSPGTAAFYDTLARAEAKAGARDAALTSFQKALNLEPNSLEAMIGMAAALLDAGNRDSAVTLLGKIDAVLSTKPPMSSQLRKELDAVRATAKASL
ncbi:MAG TPA: tetratricopeptide repeat protein [Tepidisphaeraceae bacterium]|nr:tetratricopeptide repeat protein [Tepidisphaeraceae bacterium]